MKSKRNQRSEETLTVKDAFLRMLRANKENEAGYFKARIRLVWEPFFGKHVAENTNNIMVRNRRLYVYVKNAPLRAQMMTVRQGIRDRLNKEFGEDYLEEVIIK
ncbi:DUF721 domain-containing protein [Neolewinella antarctica]|uniref:DUF721 domain-containing protein n=1 Tax=Neolewinella antarctica TaxID=442734 RepID=A0ABX0XF62_9BACT|nr:DUF721 domain-containing protein [Neolewinella antarctica]NJC27377.1 hypothetical protein [Neolewinella antarctica]